MGKRIYLTNYVERTFMTCTQASRLLGCKVGESHQKIELGKLHEYLLEIKGRMSQNRWHKFVCFIQTEGCIQTKPSK